jgi:hypothetical protein
MLNVHAMWVPSSEEKNFTGGIKNMNHSVGQKQTHIKYTELRRIIYAACSQWNVSELAKMEICVVKVK